MRLAAFAFWVIGLFAGSSRQQPALPHTMIRADSEILRNIAELKAMGFMVGLDIRPNRRGFNQPAFTDDAYVAIRTAISRLEPLERTWLKELGSPKAEQDLTIGQAQWEAISWQKKEWKPLFERVVTNLAQLMALPRKDPDSLIEQLNHACGGAERLVSAFRDLLGKMLGARLYEDVPIDNWAWRDAEELRAAGIMVGFPDGKFHG